ncbi:germination protein, Ger(x)C family [Desulfitobacterium hafniense DP7]|uniref:Germination protein, Ger(X)C family n=1 Tax=Desulfitobacterium hafniense DP7 TaxID=537010 RepID=G9XRR4_DESHA|nr:Ger(x)C family spore germination protein [Desulfitobacterium hafniense]EHL05642.1 germination protein, Ger(x)C family [Desulfitobacterium hafniense DP7]
MKKKVHGVLLSVFCASVLLMSGCWDSKEVEDLAVSTLVAWDRVTVDGKDLWQISTRILDLRVQQGNVGEKGAGAEEILLKGRGATIQEAFNNLVKRLPATDFLEHNVAILVGERVAREELANIMSADLRLPFSRISVDMFVCEGEAYQILQTQPQVSSTLSKEVRKIADTTMEESGAAFNVTALDFSKQLIRKDRDTVLPHIKIYSRQEGEETVEYSVEVEGFGLIRDSKLVGWLEDEEALGYVLSVGNLTNPEIPLAVTEKGVLFSYYMTNVKGRISSRLVEGKPKFSIQLKIDGVVHEASIPMLNEKEQPGLEKAIEKKIMDVVWQTVAKAREYDADIFGFNEYLHRYHLKEWETIAPEWRKHFRDAEIEVEVDAEIKAFGTSNTGFDF